MTSLIVVNQVILLAAGTVLLGLAGYIYRGHDKPIAESFAMLLSLLGITAVCTGVTATTGWPNKLIWLHTNLLIPVALLYFSFDYYGLSQFATPERLGAVLIPVVLGSVGGTTIFLGTPMFKETAIIETLATLPPTVFGVAKTFNQIGYYYTILLICLSLILVFRNVTRYQHLDTRLGVVIAFIGVWPWFGNLIVPQLHTFYGQLQGLIALAGGYSISAVVAVLVVGPLGLFGSSPAAGNVGPRRVLDSMEDAVIMIDDHQQVLRFNDAAVETFGLTEKDTVGRTLEDVIDTPAEQLRSDEIVPIETAIGVRQFEITRSTVTDRGNKERGEVFVLTDVTGRLTREQRLEVLNRVLRHNLRNSASSTIAHAELVSDGGTTEPAEEIIDSTKSLIGMAERAREIEKMMSAPDSEATTDLDTLIERIVEQVTDEYPTIEVTTALPDEARAAVDPTVLETVLYNLVENAAEHNDADQPIVVISGDQTGDGSLKLAVTDNGPGIPDHEQVVLEAGEEDQLEHGSGLGLWAAYWGTVQMGGDLGISENDPSGAVVTITLPAVSDRAQTV